MTNTLDAVRQLLPVVEQDQRTLTQQAVEIRQLQDALRTVQNQLRHEREQRQAVEEIAGTLRSRLRHETERRLQAEKDREQERELRQMTQGQRDEENRKRNQAEARVLLVEDETEALLQEQVADHDLRESESHEQLRQERELREQAEADAVYTARRLRRVRRKWKHAEDERDQFRVERDIERSCAAELRERLREVEESEGKQR